MKRPKRSARSIISNLIERKIHSFDDDKYIVKNSDSKQSEPMFLQNLKRTLQKQAKLFVLLPFMFVATQTSISFGEGYNFLRQELRPSVNFNDQGSNFAKQNLVPDMDYYYVAPHGYITLNGLSPTAYNLYDYYFKYGERDYSQNFTQYDNKDYPNYYYY